MPHAKSLFKPRVVFKTARSAPKKGPPHHGSVANIKTYDMLTPADRYIERQNMRKGAIAIVLAAVVWSGLAHAGAQDTTLRRGAQLVLKYAEEHGGELGKEFVKHLTFSAVIDGLKELLFNKPEQSPLPDSELRRLRETIERMLADQEFRERQKQEKEVMEYMDRWDRCSSPSYATEEPDAVIEACSEIVRSEGEP
ncbi:MAG: hypothetical protein ACREDT_08625, partial [Methylocella sp.]